MAEESKQNDPPPPSLNKPESGPPPPSLSKPGPTPAPPETGSSPPVVQEKPAVKEEDVDESLQNGAVAPLNTRLLAAIIDALVAVGIGVVVTLVLPDLLSKLAWLLQAAYWVTRDSLPFLNGQSLGKTAMKLKAVKKDGSSLVNDWQTAVIRNILLIVPFFGIIEAIVLISRDSKPERGLRLGDDWAKTRVVVYRPEEESAEESADEDKPA